MAVVAFKLYRDRNGKNTNMKRNSQRHMYHLLSEMYANRLPGEPRFILYLYYKKRGSLCQPLLQRTGNEPISQRVPFFVVGCPCELKDGGRLADICPTMLKVMGLPQPAEMTGECLIK